MIKPVNPQPQEPIGHKPPPTPSEVCGSETTNTLNALGNELWLSTYVMFPQYSNSNVPDPASFAMAMQAINQFMAAYPTPPANDPYLDDLWSQLNEPATPAHPNNLATLAANYASGGFTATGFAQYSSFISDPNSSYWAFTKSINLFGTYEHQGYQPNAQDLTKRALQNLMSDFPLSTNAAQFLSDVQTAAAQISSGTPPLDGVSLALSNLFNGPLDAAGDTLLSLAKAGNTAGLQAILAANPYLSDNIQNVLNQAGSLEFGL